MPTRLVLMRHAEAERAPHQREGDLFSVLDAGLSARGRAQAAAARDALAGEAFDAAYASPLARAVETARIVAEPHGLAVRVDPRLREIPVGPAGGDYHAVLGAILALPAALHESGDAPLAGGGTFSEATSRFTAAIDDIVTRHDRPLVVAHGLANRAWLAHVTGKPAGDLLVLDQDHACVNLIECDGPTRRVASTNRVP